MKSLSILTLAIVLGCGAASAQYCCTTEGKTFTYSVNTTEPESSTQSTSKVVGIETAADGIITVRMEDTETVPGPVPSEITIYSYYIYNPADKVTTDMLMTAEEFKKGMLDMVKQQAYAAGQYPTDEQMAEVAKAMSINGQLSIAMPAEPAAETPFDKSVLRCTIAGQSITISMSNGLFKGFEEVDTPAGKFNCLKLEYKEKESVGTVQTSIVTRWYAQGVGLVKTTSADKKGKISSETILSAISE